MNRGKRAREKICVKNHMDLYFPSYQVLCKHNAERLD